MLENTFQFIPGVGPFLEKSLWERGIRSWRDFPGEGGAIALSAKRDPVAREWLARATAAAQAKELAALAALFPAREHWRLWRDYMGGACFFDIEADGTSLMAPTVVSLFHTEGFELFAAGGAGAMRPLEELPGALSRWPIWVTFNGSLFDVPVLERHLGRLPRPALHLDLRFVCRRMGLRGGLKKIEEQLGFGRPAHLQGVDGMEAVALWSRFARERDLAALRRLVEYNLYDSMQLRTLMDAAFNLGLEQTALGLEPIPVFQRGDALYDLSKALAAVGRTSPNGSSPGG